MKQYQYIKHLLAGFLILSVIVNWHFFTELIEYQIKSQTFSIQRLALTRKSLVIVVILLLIFGPYGKFYVNTDKLLYQPTFLSKWIPPLGYSFYLLKLLVIFFGIFFYVGHYTLIAGILFTISFAILNFYVARFSSVLWISNTHLNIFPAIICLAMVFPGNQELNSAFALSFMQIYVAILYLQSLLSKLFIGGFSWFLSGQTIKASIALHGTALGKYLCKFNLFPQIAGIFTLLLQLAIVSSFFLLEYSSWFLFFVIIFHLLTYMVLKISFWFLWSLYPALFFVYQNQQTIYPASLEPLNCTVMVIIVMVLVLLLHTIYNINNWPISSHNLFCYLIPKKFKMYSIILHEDTGHSQLVHCGAVIPIEYFRANGLFGNIYVRGKEKEKQKKFAKVLLDRLNKNPWGYFDEVMPAAKPIYGNTFIGFDFCLFVYDLDTFTPVMKLTDFGKPLKVIYSFKDSSI